MSQNGKCRGENERTSAVLDLLGDQELDTEHGGVSADDVQWVSGPLDMLGVLVRGVVLWGPVWGISAR